MSLYSLAIENELCKIADFELAHEVHYSQSHESQNYLRAEISRTSLRENAEVDPFAADVVALGKTVQKLAQLSLPATYSGQFSDLLRRMVQGECSCIEEVRLALASFAFPRVESDSTVDLLKQVQEQLHLGKCADTERLLLEFLVARRIVSYPSDLPAQARHALARLYLKLGRNCESRKMLEGKVLSELNSFASLSSETLSMLNTLALAYKAEGRFPEAEALIKRGIAVQARVDDAPFFVMPILLCTLGEMYEVSGKQSEADATFTAAYCLSRELLGDESEVTALIFSHLRQAEEGQITAAHRSCWALLDQNGECSFSPILYSTLAYIARRQGKLFEAEEHLIMALRILASKSTNHSAILRINLASLYLDIKDAQPCIAVASQKNETMSRQLETKRFWKALFRVGFFYCDLGWAYQSQQKLVEAEETLEKALDILSKPFGNEQPYIALIRVRLAEVYKAQGRLAAAENMYYQVIGLLQCIGLHPAMAPIYDRLAVLCILQARETEAEALFLKGLDIRVLAGPACVYFSSIASLLQLDLWLREQVKASDWWQQEQPFLCEGVLAIAHCKRVKTLQYWCLEAAQRCGDLAKELSVESKLSQMKELCKECVKLLREEVLLCELDKDLRIEAIARHLGAVYFDLGMMWEAKQLYKYTLKVRKGEHSDENEEIAVAYNNLGCLYARTKKIAKADQMLTHSYQILANLLSEQHPKTLLVHANRTKLHTPTT